MYKFPLHLPFPYYLLLKMLPHISCSFQTTFLADRGLDNIILTHLQRQAQGSTRRGPLPVFSDVSQDLGPRPCSQTTVLPPQHSRLPTEFLWGKVANPGRPVGTVLPGDYPPAPGSWLVPPHCSLSPATWKRHPRPLCKDSSSCLIFYLISVILSIRLYIYFFLSSLTV